MKTQLICLLLPVVLIVSSCSNDPSPSTAEELAKARKELEAKKKELSDKQQIAEIEAELKSLDSQIKQVDKNGVISTGTIVQNIVESQSAKAGSTETQTSNPGSRISGTGVVMRKESSVKSEKIGNFNDNEQVSVLETKNVNNDNEAILTKVIALYASESGSGQEIMQLPKGKAVVIENYDTDQNKYYISYQDAKKGKLYAHIDSDALETISYSTWYKVKRANGQEGWVLGKFLKTN